MGKLRQSLAGLAFTTGPALQGSRRAVMQQMAVKYGRHPAFRYFVAHEVVPDMDGYDRPKMVKPIIRYVRERIRFFREAGEQFQTPIQTLRSEIGDCDDLAILAGALLEAARIPWRFGFFGNPAKHVGIVVYGVYYDLTRPVEFPAMKAINAGK